MKTGVNYINLISRNAVLEYLKMNKVQANIEGIKAMSQIWVDTKESSDSADFIRLKYLAEYMTPMALRVMECYVTQLMIEEVRIIK